ncbi:hypothetical protein JCM10449v2_002113 [Rhodotorula kratochvilovae]
MILPDASHRLSFPGVEDVHAWIEVDGQPLQVYGVEEGDRKVVGFVEAKEGAGFEVHYLDLRTSCQSAHVARLYVDGSRVSGKLLKRDQSMFNQPADDSSRKIVFKGTKETQITIRPFQFSTLRLTDDDDLACPNEGVVKNLGTIQLKYIRVRNVRSTDAFTAHTARVPTIHEKTKKAQLSHQVGFGDPVDIPAGSRSTFDWIDREDDPLSMLEFRYRSKELLQLEGHFPDSPTPSPSPQQLSLEPQPGQRTSPSPNPLAGPSQSRRRPSSVHAVPSASPAPLASMSAQGSNTARVAALEAELESLRRAERIAQLERELNQLKSSPQVKREAGAGAGVDDDGPGAKRVKLEMERDDLAARVKQEKTGGKGKGKGKPDMIGLSDSE